MQEPTELKSCFNPAIDLLSEIAESIADPEKVAFCITIDPQESGMPIYRGFVHGDGKQICQAVAFYLAENPDLIQIFRLAVGIADDAVKHWDEVPKLFTPDKDVN